MGKNKKFREGQAEQVLDDLFFQFIETARKLQPKVVIAENVKGLIMGKAKGYVKQIAQMFNHAGYECQLFLLNSAFMGVPQRRERTFFIARRKDLKLPKIDLKFNEKPITAKEAFGGLVCKGKDQSFSVMKKYYDKTKPGKSFSSVHPKGSLFNCIKLSSGEPLPTLTTKPVFYHWESMRLLSDLEYSRCFSFPDDYKTLDVEKRYVVGMSVPPFMMQRVANQVRIQWLDKLK